MIQGGGKSVTLSRHHRLTEQKAVILGTMLHVPESKVWRTTAFA